jgi:hypothetical protein
MKHETKQEFDISQYHLNEFTSLCNVSLIYCTLRFTDVLTDVLKYFFFISLHRPTPNLDTPCTSNFTSLPVQRLLFFLVMYFLFLPKVVPPKMNVSCETTKDSHGNFSALMDARLKMSLTSKRGQQKH